MNRPERRRNRLVNYDYSQNGAYFVTICTVERRNILCSIVGDGFPVPNENGMIVGEVIQEIPVKYPTVGVEKYVVMPNHIHLLLSIDRGSGTGDPSPTLGNVIGWYKYMATKRINEKAGTSGTRIFQRSYHDHVIRNEKDYRMIWNYIEGNPMGGWKTAFIRRCRRMICSLTMADGQCPPLRRKKKTG